MAIIKDPDFLTDGTEIVVDVVNRRIQLAVAGNLTNEGVSLKTVYSKLKELWRTSTVYVKYPFPMVPISDEQFELVEGWEFADTTTKNLIRDGGWAVRDTSGTILEMWACIITLGTIGGSNTIGSGTNTVYYQLGSPTADPVDAILPGPMNQAVQVYSAPSRDNFDYRNYIRIFTRNQNYTYASVTLGDINQSSLTYRAIRFPLSDEEDPRNDLVDVTDYPSSPPYSNMSIYWYTTPQVRTIDGVDYNFNVIIDGNVGGANPENPTLEEIYRFVQYVLRSPSAIDSALNHTTPGKVERELVKWVGDTLVTIYDPVEGGVYIDNFNVSQINRVAFADNTGAIRKFPFLSSFKLRFSENLYSDPDAVYRMFYLNAPPGDFNESSALIVKDSDGNDISGSVTSRELSFFFDYDKNTQAAWAANTSYEVGDEFVHNKQWYRVTTAYTSGPTFSPTVDGANTITILGPTVVVVALGLAQGQYVKVETVLEKSQGQVIDVFAQNEYAYSNP